GIVARRSCSTAGPCVRPAPPDTTRSAPSETIRSTSTLENVATTGIELASGGYLATSSTLPTTRDPTPSAKSVSVVAGVMDTIFVGSAAIVTAVPSSSVTVTGKAGAGVAVGADVGFGVTKGAAVPVPGVHSGELGPEPQPSSTRTAVMSARRRKVRRAAMEGLRRDRENRARRGAPRDVGEGLPQPVGRIAVPTLSLEGRASHCGSATGLPSRAMVTVAGLCRTLTGFAAAQRVVTGDDGRSLALPAPGLGARDKPEVSHR